MYSVCILWLLWSQTRWQKLSPVVCYFPSPTTRPLSQSPQYSPSLMSIYRVFTVWFWWSLTVVLAPDCSYELWCLCGPLTRSHRPRFLSKTFTPTPPPPTHTNCLLPVNIHTRNRRWSMNKTDHPLHIYMIHWKPQSSQSACVVLVPYLLCLCRFM